jgi:hypothetical protein
MSKPYFFKDQRSLMSAIEMVPHMPGEVKVQGNDMDAEAIKNRCLELVPLIFDYKAVLVKGAGGVGNNKSFERYAELAIDSVVQQKLEEYEAAFVQLDAECTQLIEMGAGEGIAGTVRSARSQVAAFNLAKGTIEGFRDKLNRQMSNVEEKYFELSSQLVAKRRELSRTLDSSQVSMLIDEVSSKHKTVQELMAAMDEYCALQVGLMALMIGASQNHQSAIATNRGPKRLR